MKKICLGMGIMLIFLALPVSALIYAGGSQEALKLIFGAGAPSFPEPPEGDGFIASEREDWGKYFEFIRENDPDYYTDPVAFEDSALGDYVFMLSEWESKEALSYSGIYNRTDKLTELFSVTAEGYVEAYNKRVKEGTTYVTEDMKTVNLGFFVPFLSFKKAYVATFDAGKSAQEMTSALNSVISLMGDGSGASVTIPEENHFVASYESSYMNSDWEQVPSRVTIDCYYYPGVNGIAMYAKEYDRTTGELLESEMYEHRQLDENTFIFQNNTERLMVVSDGERIDIFRYSALSGGSDGYDINSSIFASDGKSGSLGTLDAAGRTGSAEASFGNEWVTDRDISEYRLVMKREEEDYMKVSTGGRYYTLYIER